ncbi:acyltransferase family protein [Maribacter sp. X9]|uniref:acyltransferase family protein n=1 Tax=Maribacter sp. X9 TaxID=3402159 RepID=UPI003AF3A567
MKTKLNADPKERLFSLDTLRGFDMFWIIGGGSLLGALAKATEWKWVEVLAEQMHHADWEGFHFEDLIFPLFMFISGVAIPFALISKLESGVERPVLLKKVFKRMILLVLFGLIYNGILKNGFSDLRYLSVLSQIGIGYFFAAIIVLYTKTIKVRILWLIGIMVSITLLQLFTPVPSFGAGIITPEGSINAWIDQHFLPGKLIYGTYDPEGILSIVSATTVVLLGSFAGFILRNKISSPQRKTGLLVGIGIMFIFLAILISPVYPIVKKIWTVTFNMLTAGISFLLMALFYYVIDVLKWRNWTFFFRVIGLNSITIYLGLQIIDFWHASEFLFGFVAKPSGAYGDVILTLGRITLEWLFLYYLYKNKIFLRV